MKLAITARKRRVLDRIAISGLRLMDFSVSAALRPNSRQVPAVNATFPAKSCVKAQEYSVDVVRDGIARHLRSRVETQSLHDCRAMKFGRSNRNI